MMEMMEELVPSPLFFCEAWEQGECSQATDNECENHDPCDWVGGGCRYQRDSIRKRFFPKCDWEGLSL
jgi:hypothetical protein